MQRRMGPRCVWLHTNRMLISMECGGKRSATPLWMVSPFAGKAKEKRRRASLAAALHSYLSQHDRIAAGTRFAKIIELLLNPLEAIRTHAVRERRLRVLRDVHLDFPPVTRLFFDLFAVGADRQQPGQGTGLAEGLLKSME